MCSLFTGILRGLTAVVMLTSVGFRAPMVTAQEGEQLALLIGINNYQQLPTLNGALNDVEAMRDLIVHRYGFDPANVTVLTDRQATREGILQALNALASRAGPSDTVYIHYSGHGSQVEDLSGDEEDGLDETICPQDARTADVPDITDDEIDEIVTKFRTTSVFIVMDSCHSGTGLRSATSKIRARFVPQDDRIQLYTQGSKNVRTRAVVNLPETEKYVLITGAAATQNALDGPFAGGRYHGLLTYALVESLSRLPQEATPLQLKEKIDLQISGMKQQLEGHPVPDPQLEGPPDRLNQPFLAIKGQLKKSHSSTENSGVPQTYLFLRDMDEVLRKQLEADLTNKEANSATLADDQYSARFVVDCEPPSVGQAQRCVVFESNTPNKPAAVEAPVGEMAAVITGVIKANLLTGALQSLLPDPPNLQLDFSRVSQELAPEAATRYRGINVSNNQPPEKLAFYRPGSSRTQQNSLQIEVRSSDMGYLTLVYVDSRGGLQVIFPDPRQNNDFYPKGKIPQDLAVRLPDSLLNNNRAGYHWDFGPPAGQDTVIAFYTTDGIQAEVLRTGIEEVAAGAESNAIKALGDLSAHLNAGYSGASNGDIRVSEGGAGQQQPAPGWGMAKIVLDIDK